MSQVISNKVYESIQPYNVQPTTTGTILYANKFADTAPVAMPEELKRLIDGDVGLNGTNLLVQLSNKFLFFRNGPWYVDSRDGVIYIHNRKFQEEVVHTYTYQNENGEVLKVQFQTNYITKSTKVVLHENIDPGTKRIEAEQSVLDDPEIYPEMKPIIAQVDNTQTSTTASDMFEDYHAYSGNASGAKKYFDADQLRKRYELARKRDTETRSKVAEDPTYDIRRAQEDIVSGKTSEDLRNIIRKTMNESGVPSSIKEQMDIWLRDVNLAKDPEACKAKLAQILQGLYYSEPHWHVEIETVDPIQYSDTPDMDTTPDSYWKRVIGFGNDGSIAQARQQGFYRMQKDPNVTVLSVDEWTKGGYITTFSAGGNLPVADAVQSGPAPSKVKVIRRTNKPVAVPLYSFVMNLIGRYGGLKTYMWASQANQNGGLKSREREVRVLMTVVGRPQLTSSMVINIQNIGKRWSGPWYVKKCTHRMDPGVGYVCELDLVRNSAIGGVTTSSTGISTQNILHVWTDENGKTQYGQKPEEEMASKFMATYNKDERAFYAERDYSSGGNSRMGDLAFKMAYNEANADDPYAMAAGTVRSDSVVVDSKGVTYIAPFRQVTPEEAGITEKQVKGYVNKLPNAKDAAQKRLEAIQINLRSSLKSMQDKAKETVSELTQEEINQVMGRD